jgi:Domain of unknown function (DUF4126)
VDLLPLVLTTGWGSGINAYAVVLVMGLCGRFAGVDSVPAALTHTDVLVAAALMFGIEFVTDKIPYVDSGWDAISTAIRPTVGAIIGLLVAGDAGSLHQAVYGIVGGGSALASHLVKGGLRLAVNSSPEPVTNVTVSLGEDLTVAGVITLALWHPWVALGVATTLFVTGVGLVFVLLRWIRGGLRRWEARRTERASPG